MDEVGGDPGQDASNTDSTASNTGGSSANSIAAEQPSIKLRVKTINEAVINVAVPSLSSTVAELKRRLSPLVDLPTARVRLIYRGKLLGDDDRLSTYKIEDGVTLHLVARSVDAGVSSPDYGAMRLPGDRTPAASPAQVVGSGSGVVTPQGLSLGQPATGLRSARSSPEPSHVGRPASGAGRVYVATGPGSGLVPDPARGISATEAAVLESSSATAASVRSTAPSALLPPRTLEHVHQSLHTLRTVLLAAGWGLDPASGQLHGPATEPTRRLPLLMNDDDAARIVEEQQRQLVQQRQHQHHSISHAAGAAATAADAPSPSASPSALTTAVRLARTFTSSSALSAAASISGPPPETQLAQAQVALVQAQAQLAAYTGLVAAAGAISRSGSPIPGDTSGGVAGGGSGASGAQSDGGGGSRPGSAPAPSLATSQIGQQNTTAIAVRTRRYFAVGQWIDCLDTIEQWLEATVLKISGEYVYIHYNGWPDRWNEWLHVNSPRIAPFRSRSQHMTLAIAQSPMPVSLLPTSSVAPIGLPLPGLLMPVAGAGAASSMTGSQRLVVGSSLQPPPVASPAAGSSTPGAAIRSVRSLSASGQPSAIPTIDSNTTRPCARVDAGEVKVEVRLRNDDIRPTLPHVVEAVSLLSGLLERLTALATEQPHREARRAALLSGAGAVNVYGRQMQDLQEMEWEPAHAGVQHSDSESGPFVGGSTEPTSLHQPATPPAAVDMTPTMGGGGGLAAAAPLTGGTRSSRLSHGGETTPYRRYTAVVAAGSADRLEGSNESSSDADYGGDNSGLVDESGLRDLDLDGSTGSGGGGGAGLRIVQTPRPSPHGVPQQLPPEAADGSPPYGVHDLTAAAEAAIPTFVIENMSSSASSASVGDEASADVTPVGNALRSGNGSGSHASDDESNTSERRQSLAAAAVVGMSLPTVPDPSTSSSASSSFSPSAAAAGGFGTAGRGAAALPVHASALRRHSRDGVGGLHSDSKVEADGWDQRGAGRVAESTTSRRTPAGVLPTSTAPAITSREIESRARAARVRDYQRGLEDRSEIEAIAAQLAPVMDRVGRILTDMAPMVEALGRSPGFVSRETIVTRSRAPPPSVSAFAAALEGIARAPNSSTPASAGSGVPDEGQTSHAPVAEPTPARTTAVSPAPLPASTARGASGSSDVTSPSATLAGLSLPSAIEFASELDSVQSAISRLRGQVSRVRNDTQRLSTDVNRLLGDVREATSTTGSGSRVGDGHTSPVATAAGGAAVGGSAGEGQPSSSSSVAIAGASAGRHEPMDTTSYVYGLAPTTMSMLMQRVADNDAAISATGADGTPLRRSDASAAAVAGSRGAGAADVGAFAFVRVRSAASLSDAATSSPSAAVSEGPRRASSPSQQRQYTPASWLYNRYITTPAMRDAAVAGYTLLIRGPLSVTSDVDPFSVRQPGFGMAAADGSFSLIRDTERGRSHIAQTSLLQSLALTALSQALRNAEPSVSSSVASLQHQHGAGGGGGADVDEPTAVGGADPDPSSANEHVEM